MKAICLYIFAMLLGWAVVYTAVKLRPDDQRVMIIYESGSWDKGVIFRMEYLDDEVPRDADP